MYNFLSIVGNLKQFLLWKILMKHFKVKNYYENEKKKSQKMKMKISI